MGEKRDRTRATLIEVAWRLFSEAGIDATSLDAIAAAAGMTKGAVYSNFSSKDELIGAAVAAHSVELRPALVAGMSETAMLRAWGGSVIALMPDMATRASFSAELQYYAAARPSLREQLASLQTEALERAVSRVSRIWPATATLSARQVVYAVQALALGFYQQRLITPELISDDDIISAFVALRST